MTQQSGSSGSSTLAGDTDVTVTSPASGDKLQYSTSDNKWHNAAIGTVVTATIATDHVMTAATAWETLVSLTVTAGMWLVLMQTSVATVAGANAYLTRLFDGTTGSDVFEGDTAGASFPVPLSSSAVYVASGNTTLSLQGYQAFAATSAWYAKTKNGAFSGNTSIKAVRIA